MGRVVENHNVVQSEHIWVIIARHKSAQLQPKVTVLHACMCYICTAASCALFLNSEYSSSVMTCHTEVW